MAETTEIARLLLQAEEVGFSDARDRVVQLEKELALLQTMYRDGAVDIDTYRDHGARLLGEIDSLRGGIKQAEDAIKRYGDAQKAAAALTGQATSKLAGFGQVGLQLGRFAQDFQAAGFMGIANNIEGLVQALGGGPGLAGTLTLLGTAYLIFKPKLDDFFKSLQNEAPSLLSDRLMALKKQIEELEKKPIKLSADITELENARKELQALEDARRAFEEFGKLRAGAVKESGTEVQNVLAETPGGAGRVLDALKKAAVAQAKANDQAVQVAEFEVEDAKRKIRENEEALKQRSLPAQAAQAFIDDIERQKKFQAAAEERKNTALDLIAGRAEEEIGTIYKGAVEGDVARQRELQQKLRKVGEDELARQIHAVSPENIRAKQLEEEGGKIEEEALKELERARKEQSNALAERLESEGKILEGQAEVELKAIKDEKDRAEKSRQANQKAHDARVKALAAQVGGGPGGLQEQAGAAAARLAAQGMPEERIQETIITEVQRQVARLAPAFSAQQQTDVAVRIGMEALNAPRGPEVVQRVQEQQRRAAEQQQRRMTQQQRDMAEITFAQEAFTRGFDVQASQEIAKRAAAEFARTGDEELSLAAAIREFRAHLMRLQEEVNQPLPAPHAARGAPGAGHQASNLPEAIPAAEEQLAAAEPTPTPPAGAGPSGPTGLQSALAVELLGALKPEMPAPEVHPEVNVAAPPPTVLPGPDVHVAPAPAPALPMLPPISPPAPPPRPAANPVTVPVAVPEAVPDLPQFPASPTVSPLASPGGIAPPSPVQASGTAPAPANGGPAPAPAVAPPPTANGAGQVEILMNQINGYEAALAGATQGLQGVVSGQVAHLARMGAMLARIQAGNAALQARQRTAASWQGG